MELTQDYLKSILHYAQEEGIFIWKIKPSNLVNPGDIAGRLTPENRIIIGIKRKNYRAHRLAWFYIYGEWPCDEIDHKNGDPTDNRICNLRAVNRRENSENMRKARSHNKTGLLGVIQRNGRYFSQIVIHGKKKYIGSFDTKELAYEAYVKTKRQYHDGCTL